MSGQPLCAGSLCSGYGGLEMGAELAFGPLQHVWHAEFDAAPSAVLAHRWPGTPNLGDIAAITAANGWAGQAPIDILLAGYPCQGESDAGLRRGADDPRFRWPDVAAAIRALRPRIVVLENVRGHLNRSFPRVVADLAAMRYLGRWRCVRASDAGAAHRRERLFVLAWPEEEAPPRLRGTGPVGLTADLALLPTPTATDGQGGPKAVPEFRTSNGSDHGPRLRDVAAALLPTPRASDTGTEGRRASDGFRPPLSEVVLPMFPTPRTSDANGAGDHGDGGMDLRTAVTLLPTPTVQNSHGNGNNSRGELLLPGIATADAWGDYAPAITRWATVVGRLAPAPTQCGRNGQRQLSPLFVEWLMGLPAGHVTEVVTNRGQALKVLGNGVVPRAAALALHLLTADVPAPEVDLLDLMEVAA